MSAQDDYAVDVLARTIWGESRGQSLAGMEAVANVVLNRVKIAQARGRFWWGHTIIEVCRKPFQFSCWNGNDPNLPKLLAVTERNIHFVTALRIARRAVMGTLVDNTKGATHYHAHYVSPRWARGQTPSVIIGDHIFYAMPDG